MSNAAEMEMPRYVSHKKVWALEIDAIGDREPNADRTGFTRWLTFRDSGYAPIEAGEHMFARYLPAAGDYLVRYADGYESFSPRKAFLEGYTRDEPNALDLGAAARAVR